MGPKELAGPPFHETPSKAPSKRTKKNTYETDEDRGNNPLYDDQVPHL